MKTYLKYMVLYVFLFLSGNVLAQNKLIKNRTRANLETTTQVAKINATQWKLKPYSEARVLVKTYKKVNKFGMKIPVIKKIALPKKTIDINEIYEDEDWGWGWIYKVQTNNPQFMTGVANKTNIHYFKNIRKKVNTGFKDEFDHIVVTDTLFAPTFFWNTEGRPKRAKRSYIKIIANCIIYEKPIKPITTKGHDKTDYVFAARSIYYKSKDKDLQKRTVGSPPWVVAATDSNIKLHKDPFGLEETILLNRLFIGIMDQISIELTNEKNDWKKDQLLIEFEKYRHKVITGEKGNILRKDIEYKDKFVQLCNDFDSNLKSDIERVREVNGLKIIVEGKVDNLNTVPFKYYALPTKATLLPVKNHNSGIQDKLGDLYYKPTGDSKMSLTLQVNLGYDAIEFAEVNQVLKEKGVLLENNPPITLMSIREQPLRAKGRPIGSIIPISNQILRFEIDLADEGLDIIKLFLRDDNIFDLGYKIHQEQKDGIQKITLEIPEEILKQLDFDDLRNEFNIVEINTITDAVMISSNLKPFLEDTGEGELDYGALDYIEVSLEFLFDDKTVFRGPKRFSSHSVHGSKEKIEFIKYSDNYAIKVTGTAFYEFGKREIQKETSFTNIEKNIILQDRMFENKNLKN